MWVNAIHITALFYVQGAALMADWSKALSLTARCLSSLRACPDVHLV